MLSENAFIKVYTKFLAKYAFHLYSTHGIPKEVTWKHIEKDIEAVILGALKHKDFKFKFSDYFVYSKKEED